MGCEDKETKTGAMRLLVTLDQNYLTQLQVLLTSVKVNNSRETVHLYLMHSGLGEESL